MHAPLGAARRGRAAARIPVPLLVLTLLAPVLDGAQPATFEYELKAAFLVNFLKYVEWPTRDTGDLVVCVAGQNPFGTSIDRLAAGERIGSRAIRVRVILEPDPPCHAVFIPRTANRAAYLRAVADTPTLTIGETPGFLDEGGMINFVQDGARLTFEINVDAARRANLAVSSRLLRLAAPRPAQEPR
jgi:hypothetical protein